MEPTTSGRRMRALTCVSLATLALLATSAPGHATSVTSLTVVDLLTHAETIVAGQVQSVTDGFDAKGLPYTEVTMKVSDTIRGERAETYTFRQFGLDKPRKLADGRTYLGHPTGFPTWRTNEAAILFMYSKAKRTGLQTTVGLGQGKLSLANGVAMNGYDNVGLFTGVQVNRGLLDSSEQELFDTTKGPVNSDVLQRFLHRAVDGNWVQHGSIANAKH